jgi:SAM-dependent methyltransferase
MRNEPPDHFNIDKFYHGVNFFQGWEIFPGIRAEGPKDVIATLELLDFPHDLNGRRVLEIAPWNGFFSFECVRRGASSVVALGPDDPEDTGFNETKRLLEVDNVEYIRESVYNLPKLNVGGFDIVLCLGLLYHLRHPLLALDHLYDCCDEQLFVDCAVIDNGSHFVLAPDQEPNIAALWRSLAHLPLVYFSHLDEVAARDPYNWSIPTSRALRDWIVSTGFVVEHERNLGEWAYLRARKGTRGFHPLLEGYNPVASGRR